MNPPHVCHLVWEVDEGQETKELWICTAINRRSLSRNVGGRLANHQVHLFTFENSAFQLLFAFNPTPPSCLPTSVCPVVIFFSSSIVTKNSLIFPQPVWIRRLDTGQRSRVLTRARLLPSSRPPRLSLGCWPPPEPHHATLGHDGVSTTPQQAPFFCKIFQSIACPIFPAHTTLYGSNWELLSFVFYHCTLLDFHAAQATCPKGC